MNNRICTGPDFEVDLQDHGIHHDGGALSAVFAGVILLLAIVGAVAFIVTQVR